MKKKGSISLSAKWIVLIILAIIILFLIMSFTVKIFGESRDTMEELISTLATPPIVVLSSPTSGIYSIDDSIYFDASKSIDVNYEIQDFFWDINGDNFIDYQLPNFRHKYIFPGLYTIKVKVMNTEGAIGEETVDIILATNNEKNPDLYGQNTIFFAHKDSPENILKAVTLSSTLGKNKVSFKSFVVYDSIDEPELNDIISQQNLDKIIFFEPIPDLDKGQINADVRSLTEFSYEEFWNVYQTAVLVSHDSQENWIISTLLAASTNSPIFFTDYDDYNNLKNKIVYIVGSVDQLTLNYLEDNSKNIEYIIYAPNQLKTIPLLSYNFLESYIKIE